MPILLITLTNDQLIASAAAIIALFALLFSWLSYQNTNRQFVMLNQGYLQIDVSTHLDIRADSQVQPNGFPLPETPIHGLNFMVLLTNIGNSPFKYDVERCNISVNGTRLNRIDPEEDKNKGILYPKQALPFVMKTTQFNNQGNPIPYRDLTNMDVTSDLAITYTDLNLNKVKKVIRTIRVAHRIDMIGVTFLTFDDQV